MFLFWRTGAGIDEYLSSICRSFWCERGLNGCLIFPAFPLGGIGGGNSDESEDLDKLKLDNSVRLKSSGECSRCGSCPFVVAGVFLYTGTDVFSLRPSLCLLTIAPNSFYILPWVQTV